MQTVNEKQGWMEAWESPQTAAVETSRRLILIQPLCSTTQLTHLTSVKKKIHPYKTVRRITIQSCGRSHGRCYLSSLCANTSTDAGKHALTLWLCSLLRNPHYVSCTQSELVARYRLQRTNRAALRQNKISAVQCKSWISKKIITDFCNM